MLEPAKLDQLHQLIAQSTAAEWLWMSGYLAGLANATPDTPPRLASTTEVATISIIYGTETGNSKKVATQLTGKLKQLGFKTKLSAAAQIDPATLAKEKLVVIAISTQGEGEPPANAKALYDFLHHTTQLLPQLRYSIVALGSKSYPLFCQAGIDLDTQLKRLQASSIIPIALCDDDYEPVAEAWMVSLINALQQTATAKPTVPAAISKTEQKKSFVATLGKNIILNDRGSSRQVHHLEFDLSDDIMYNPGNAVGIVPHNEEEQVQKLLLLLKMKPQQLLAFKGIQHEAYTLLKQTVSIIHLSIPVIRKYAQLVQSEIPETRMDLYDLLRIYPLPAEFEAQAVIDLLNPITPRLYTISSAPNAHPGQLHLTAALHRFTTQNGEATGFGSTYLTQLKAGSKIELFLHQQKNFTLPRSDKHLVMIGQGTGIAPFRAMIAERDATGAAGKNWLFFGEEDFIADFYYQTEIQSWMETGSLNHAHFAFQKNGRKKAQLHELLAAEADNLWTWLQTGAYIFISGEKEPMAKKAEEQLLQIIATKKQVSLEEATNYLKQLAKEGRYAKELY